MEGEINSDNNNEFFENCGVDEISKCNWFYLSFLLKHDLQIDNYLLNFSTQLLDQINKDDLASREMNGGRSRYLTGSTVEGLFLPLRKGLSYLLTTADYDEMDVMTSFTFHHLNEHCPETNDSLEIRLSEFPGYCHVYNCDKKSTVKSFRMRQAMNNLAAEGYPFAKSVLGVKQEDRKSDTCVAITFTQEMSPILYSSFAISADIVQALYYPFWPSEADEWYSRERHYEWPPLQLIEKIHKNGCHIVPKSHPLSSDQSEWRYSFSITAEIPLAKSLNRLQRFSYLVIKMFMKHFQLNYPQFQVTTYHLKTVLFWYCEQTCAQDWTEAKIGMNTMKILEKLIGFFEKKNLPNYFFRRNNMISHLDEKSIHFQETLRILKLIREKPVDALLQCENLSFYSNKMFMELFQPILNTLYANKATTITIIAALCRVIEHHYSRTKELKYSLPALEDMLTFMSDEIQKMFDLKLFYYTAALEHCHNKMGNVEKALKMNEKNVELMENDVTTDLKLIGGFLVNRAQYILAIHIMENNVTREIISEIDDLFSIARQFYSKNDDDTLAFASWKIHYANFLVFTKRYTEAEKYLSSVLHDLKTLQSKSPIRPFLHSVYNDETSIDITASEYVCFDHFIQAIFQVKHRSAEVLRLSHDCYDTDGLTTPMITLAYYLYLNVLDELNKEEEAIILLTEFENHIEHDICQNADRNVSSADSFNLLAHSFLRFSILVKVEYWFSKCFLGYRINVEMNAYHDYVMTFYKLCCIYDECFSGVDDIL